MWRMGIAALTLAVAGCGPATYYANRVALERPVVSEGGETAWFVEVWNVAEQRGRATVVRQRTSVVICRPDRTPPCVRVSPAAITDPVALGDWVDSEPRRNDRELDAP